MRFYEDKEFKKILEHCLGIPMDVLQEDKKKKILGKSFGIRPFQFAEFVLNICEYYQIEIGEFFNNLKDTSYEGLLKTIEMCLWNAKDESCNNR